MNELDLDKKSIVLGASKVGVYINRKGSCMIDTNVCIYAFVCVCVLGVLKTWSVEMVGCTKGWLGEQLAGADAGSLFGAFGTAEIPPLEGETPATHKQIHTHAHSLKFGHIQ